MRYVFGEWSLDTQRYELRRAGRVWPLRRKAFQVLAYLLAQGDRVVAKDELCAQVWPQQFISDTTLESTIKAVRQALGDNGRDQRLVQTVYGQGYRLIVPVAVRPVSALTDEGMAPPGELPAALPVPDTGAANRPPAPVACAAPPDEPVPAGATRAPLPGAPDAERRQLTVLVCTLRAEPPLTRPCDADDLYAVLRTYYETCARIIRQCEGSIAQYRGEELMVYFGAPQAHDDAPQRAVRAGLRLVDAMRELPPRLGHQHEVRWTIRVGVDTGLVVVGALGDDGPHARWVLGDTPTRAAQLQERAAPDTVVISAATQRLLHGAFVCHPLEPPSGQDLTPSLQASRVVREREAHPGLDVVPASGLTPLVGREPEVGLLEACWEQAKAGRGRVVLIQGEAGIGKSRLVRVLHEHLAAESHTAFVWRGSPAEQQSALQPVRRHLQRLVQGRPEAPPAAILQRLEAGLAASGLPLPEVVPVLAALLGLPLPAHYPPLQGTPQGQRQQTLDALLTWLLAAATRHPVLCLVEDLHWLDPSTLEFLSLLIDQVPTTRLLLGLTCRPEFHPPWGFRAHLTHVTLDRLSPTQAAVMVQRVAGRALPPAVQQHLVAQTDGVPLFIEEVTKLLLESGSLPAPMDHDAWSGPLPALTIPATLHDALMARLDRLGPSKAVAQLGAVLGRTFAYTVLHAVAPWEETTLQHSLRQLVEAELLYQHGVPPQATYRFKHALIQDAASQSLLRSTRQQYHRRIAQVLEQRFPETGATQPELLAHHYTEAGCPAQALPYWQRAGQQAMERASYGEAADLLSQGLALVERLPHTPALARQELDMQVALGLVLQVTKGLAAPEVAATYHRAYALCRHVRETPQLLPVLEGLVVFFVMRGELPTARELGEEMLSLAQRVHDPAGLGTAHIMLGNVLCCCGQFGAARTHLEQGLALDTPTPPHFPGLRRRVFGLSRLASTLWYLGYPEQALQRTQAALTLARTWAHPVSLAAGLLYAAQLHWLRREGPPTYEHAEAALALAREHGLTQRVAEATMLRGWALVAQGQRATGIAQLHQGLAAYRATGAPDGSYQLLLAEALRHVKQSEEGLRVIAEALAMRDSRGEDLWTAELYRLKGELLLMRASKHQAETERCFRQALEIARRQGAKSLELRAAMSLARLWQQQGKRAEAYELLAPIYGWCTEGFDTTDLQEAKVLLGELEG